MPFYAYKCQKCGLVFRDLATITERNDPVDCEKEGCCGKAHRAVGAELAPRSGQKWVTDNPRWSRSMGVPPMQVEEFRKRFPGSVYDDNGRLLIKNRKDKLRQMKERGFVELPDRKD
jgi:putative FmdB family regulatory protein